MAKTVKFSPKPVEKSAAAEQWVDSGEPALVGAATERAEGERAEEVTKRLTIDLPASLHTRVKAGCALRGVKMADEIRRLLEVHFPG